MPTAETRQALAALLDQLQATEDDKFANLRRLQAEKPARQQRQAAPSRQINNNNNGLRFLEEERARNAAAIAAAAAAATASAYTRPPAGRTTSVHPSANSGAGANDIQRILKASQLKRSASTPDVNRHLDTQTSATKMVGGGAPKMALKILEGLFGDVKARSWSAKSSSLQELERERLTLEGTTQKEESEIRALERLAREIRLSGGGDKEVVEIVARKLDANAREVEIRKMQEARRLGKTLEDMKKEQEMSLAEQEKQARLQYDIQRLTIIKLQLEQREAARKELASMQDKLKDLGIPAKLIIEEPKKPQRRPHDDESLYSDDELFDEEDSEFGESQYSDDDYADMAMFGGSAGFSDFGAGRGGREAEIERRRRAAKGGQQGRGDLFGDLHSNPRLAAEELFGPSSSKRGIDRRGDLPRTSSMDPRLMDRAKVERERERQILQRQRSIDQGVLSDSRGSLRRTQILPAQESGLIRRDDPRLDPLSSRYNPKVLQYYKQQQIEEEERKKSLIMQARNEKERLIQEERSRQAAIEERERQLRQVSSVLTKQQIQKQEEQKKRAKEQEIHAQNQLEKENLRQREEILRKEEALERLEHLMKEYPGAAIKGLDLKRAKNDLNLLDQALRQIEENIKRGEAPMIRNTGRHGSSSSGLAPPNPNLAPNGRRKELRDYEKAMVLDFIKAPPAQQEQYLKALPDNAQTRQWFLEAALELAEPIVRETLRERYKLQQIARDMREHELKNKPIVVPSIVIDHVATPPRRNQDDIEVHREQQQAKVQQQQNHQQSGKKNKGKGRQVDAVEVPQPSPTIIINQHIHTPAAEKGSPSSSRPIRNVVGHPGDRNAVPLSNHSHGEDEEDAFEAQAVEDELARIQAEKNAIEDSERDLLEREKREREYELEAIAREEMERDRREAEEEVVRLAELAEAEERVRLETEVQTETAKIEPEGWGTDQVVETGADNPPGHEADAWGDDPTTPKAVADTWEEGANTPKVAANDAWGEEAAPAEAANDAWGDKPNSPIAASPSKTKTPSVKAASVAASPPVQAASPAASARMPSPPPLFSAPVSPRGSIGSTTSRKGSLVLSPKEASPMPDLAAAVMDSPALIELDIPSTDAVADAWGDEAAVNEETQPRSDGTGSRKSSKAGSPAMSKAASVRSNVSLPTSPAKVSSPVTSQKASPMASVKSAKATPVATPTSKSRQLTPQQVVDEVLLPEVVDEHNPPTPKASSRAPSAASTPKLASPTAAQTPSAKSIQAPSPKAQSPTNDAWASPKAASIASKAASPSVHNQSKPPSAWNSPAKSVKATPKAAPEGAPSPARSVKDAWGSPAAHSTHSIHATQKVAEDGWPMVESPKAMSIASSKKAASIKGSPEKAAAGWGDSATSGEPAVQGWGSPEKVTASIRGTPVAPAADAWGIPHSVKGASPAVSDKSAAVVADAWGDSPKSTKSVARSVKASNTAPASPAPVAAGWGSPTRSVKSTKSVPVAGSPAFGLAVSPPANNKNWGDWSNNDNDDLPLSAKAQKGSDPVVVSLAAENTPVHQPKHLQHSPANTDEDARSEGGDSEEGTEFNMDDFPVFYAGDPVELEDGEEIARIPEPRPFREVYPKTGAATTEEAVIDHFCRLGHAHGFDAIIECAIHQDEDKILIQGYFVCLQQAVPQPTPPPPPSQPVKTGKKSAYVTEASDAGW